MSNASTTPRVSIGLPVYNGERYLAEAIDAIRAQTFTDWELIISDNASTDSTPQICAEYAARDPRIRYSRQSQNVGIARNFNRVIDLSRGEYFRWQAHDDLCAPELVERCLEVLEKRPDATLAFTRTTRIDASGAPISTDLYTVGNMKFSVGSWDDPVDYDVPDVVERCRRFLRPNRPAAPAYLFGVMRSAPLKATRRQGSYLAADEVFLLELLLKGPFIQIKEPLFFVRHFDDNATALGLKGDLLGLQARLDPALATSTGVLISKYQRYWEYFVALQREPIDPLDKAKLAAHIGGQVLGRARAVIDGVVRGQRTILGRPPRQ